MRQTFIEKFVVNKDLPNIEFSMCLPNNMQAKMDLKDTLQRIKQEGLSGEVKKILKKGQFRNASKDSCLGVFEGAAQRFMLQDFNKELADKVIDVIDKVHQRKETVYLQVVDAGVKIEFEVKFKNHDEEKFPYSLINQDTTNSIRYTKKDLLEYLIKTDIKEVI
ncbi:MULTISPECIES: hypothetical protein [Bacillus cereus group]|uniref:hypothetical protein n=1 Tax=Bacillus cereus group TaxID=86661 RepID=UPI0005CEA950|nr:MULTISPECIES: hypothetical protein [Bacillus cereus group]TBL18323.1 hypothetical protein EYB35_03235 [Bacillus paranthracis]